jgi:magnesium transporter
VIFFRAGVICERELINRRAVILRQRPVPLSLIHGTWKPLADHSIPGEIAVVASLSKANLNDPVTQHLHQDFAHVHADQTVAEALDWIRTHPPRGRIIYFYVVDGEGRLQGVVPTRRLVLSPRETPLADIMVRQVIALPAEATVLEACEFFIQHRLLAFPVVDDQRRLLGVVDMELYTDELSQLGEASAREDLFQLVGVHLANAQDSSALAAFRYRFPWLGCNLAAGILAAILSGVYQEELEKVVALAFFIPVVLNLAESVSSQSVSLALQMLHDRPPTWKSMLAKLRGEFTTGLFLGLASGAIVGLVGLVWLRHGRMALCLLGGISGGVAGAAVLGLALPFILRLLRLEPRVAAGPVALAGADVITILLYLNLARWLLA